MSAPSWFLAGLLVGAAAMLGGVLLWHASRAAIQRGRQVLYAGGLTAAAAVALLAGLSVAINSHQEAAIASPEAAMTDPSPPPMPRSGTMPSPSVTPAASAMPPASLMSRILAMPSAARPQSAQPMDEAAADLAARLERQGGSAADWNLLAQAYDFLGRPQDAQRARARAAAVGSAPRTR